VAVTAKFTADFSQFHAAAKEAEARVRAFETSAGKMGPALDKAVARAVGPIQKLTREAALLAESVERAGGLSDLTGSRLQTLGSRADQLSKKFLSLGLEVPTSLQSIADKAKTADSGVTGMFNRMTSGVGGVVKALGPLSALVGGSFSVGALVSFGRAVLDDADALTKLSDQTGITTKGLQELRAIAGESGNTLDEVTRAVTSMQNRLGEGDSSAVGAIKRLGLSLDEIKKLEPQEQFYAIARAIQQVPDPMDRTRTAMDLFGDSGAKVLPTLRADIDGIKDSVKGMSQESVAALDRAGDALSRWSSRAKSQFGEASGQVVQGLEAMINRWRILTSFGRENVGLPNVPSPRGLTQTPLAVPGLPTPEVMEASDRALKRLAESTAKQQREAEKAAETTKRFQESVKNLTTNTIGASRGFGMFGQLATEAAGRGQEFANVLEGLNEDGTLVARSIQNIDVRLQSLGGKGFKTAVEGGQSFASFLKKDLAGVVTSAFSGGGDVARSIGSSLGGFLTGPNGVVGKAIGAIGGKLGNVLGSVAGPLGSILGGIGGSAIGGLFKKLFGNPEKEINPIREAFVQASGGLERLGQKAARAGVTLREMLDARNPQAYQKAIENLQRAFQFQEDALATAEETAARYGLTLAELGPALQRSQLDKRAQGLFKDFEVLTSAGVNVDTVLGRMGESLNQFLQDALATGTEVPSAMEPMLKKMAELGILVDKNGNVITDLEDAGVKFSVTMSEGFRDLIGEVRKLTEAIARGLGVALDTVADKAKNIRFPEFSGNVNRPGISDDIPSLPTFQGGISQVTRPAAFIGSPGLSEQTVTGRGHAEATSAGGGAGTVVFELNGRTLAEVLLPDIAGAVQRFRLA